jgi:hypothetical protein
MLQAWCIFFHTLLYKGRENVFQHSTKCAASRVDITELVNHLAVVSLLKGLGCLLVEIMLDSTMK